MSTAEPALEGPASSGQELLLPWPFQLLSPLPGEEAHGLEQLQALHPASPSGQVATLQGGHGLERPRAENLGQQGHGQAGGQGAEPGEELGGLRAGLGERPVREPEGGFQAALAVGGGFFRGQSSVQELVTLDPAHALAQPLAQLLQAEPPAHLARHQAEGKRVATQASHQRVERQAFPLRRQQAGAGRGGEELGIVRRAQRLELLSNREFEVFRRLAAGEGSSEIAGILGLSVKSVPLDHNDIAFLQYTGGTTGVAKGAIL
ncbi:MAG TPA: LuxR C-terminal-related transcriptional regulator, partial [Thermoanaerobaculia bacterium]|nr:LuxR C-terminal-related transcriptional regulator [Thermoanaerobaculia bacterium]